MTISFRESTTTDRRALQAVAAQFFVNGAVLASFVPRLPEIRDSLDLSLDELGAILTAGAALGLLASLWSPRIIAAFGTRRALANDDPRGVKIVVQCSTLSHELR